MTNKKHIRRGLAGLLAVVMLFSLVPAAFAVQENGYHDPAEHWRTATTDTHGEAVVGGYLVIVTDHRPYDELLIDLE